MNAFKPWKVCHLELSEDLPQLAFDPCYQGLYLVFWWRGIPLGEQQISNDQLPMNVFRLGQLIVKAITPAVGDHLLEHGFKARLPSVSKKLSCDQSPDLQALKSLDQPLQMLGKQLTLPRNELPNSSVSVVICTRDRTEQLQRCLSSLQELSIRPYEILVVDNAPSSWATRRLVEGLSGIRYVLESCPGLSVARNTGIRCSTGDIIAFTDDDVVVHHDWIARLQQSFVNPRVMAVTGLVLPAALETEVQVMFQQSGGSFGWGYRALTFDSRFFDQTKSRGVPVWRIGAGANMAFRRKAFELIADFDARLGAGAAGCSEDSELWYRVLAEGWLCRYEPTAVVHHYHRDTLDGLKTQMYYYMRGHMAALLIQFNKYRHWGNLYRAFGILPWHYTMRLKRVLISAFRHNDSKTKVGILLAQMRGCMAGVRYYLRNQNSANTQPVLSTTKKDV